MLRPLLSIAVDQPVRVSDLIDAPTCDWNRTKILESFIPMDASVILSIPLCNRPMEDFWAWHYDRRGVFSVRSAYRMLVATKYRREAWLEGM